IAARSGAVAAIELVGCGRREPAPVPMNAALEAEVAARDRRRRLTRVRVRVALLAIGAAGPLQRVARVGVVAIEVAAAAVLDRAAGRAQQRARSFRALARVRVGIADFAGGAAAALRDVARAGLDDWTAVIGAVDRHRRAELRAAVAAVGAGG